VKYLEETANNILRSLIMEMTTGGDKGGGGDDMMGGGDDFPLGIGHTGTTPPPGWFDPEGRPIEEGDPGYFWNFDWDRYSKGFPQQGPDELDVEYEDRVRQFYRDLHDRLGDNEGIFPYGFGPRHNLIPNPYGKEPPLIPDPSVEAAPGYIEPGGLQPDMLLPSLVGGGGLVGPIGRGIKGIVGGFQGLPRGVQFGLGAGGSVAADQFVPYDAIEDWIDRYVHGFDYGPVRREPVDPYSPYLFPDSTSDTPGG